MKHLEATCLAIVIEYPNLAPILFENATEETWTVHEFKMLFLALQEMWEKREEWSWPLLADQHPCVVGLAELLVALPTSMSRETIIDCLSKIKRNKAHFDLLVAIQREASSVEPDFREIIEIARSSEVTGGDQENPAPLEAFDSYLNWLHRKHAGFFTGFPSFDRLTDTLNPGELVTFMGRPGTGKTFAALNVLLRLINQNPETPISFFSLEMPKQSIAERIMQIEFKRGRFDLKYEVDKDPAGFRELFGLRFKTLNIFDHIYSANEMALLIKLHGTKVAFVDFLGLIRPEDEGASAYQQATKKIMDLKHLAKKMDCLVFLMAQLSRAGGDGSTPVTLDMARDAGTVEELSDFVYGIWDPSKAESAGPEWRDRLCLKLLKNKRGPTMGLTARFDKLTGLITEEQEELE